METKVAEGERNFCLCGWFKGSGSYEGSLFKEITHTGGKLVSVKAFLVLFSNTDMSNERPLLSNIACLNL